MLLRELTNRYPPKVIQQPAVPAIEQQKQAQPGNSLIILSIMGTFHLNILFPDDVKTEPRVDIKTEKPDTPLSQGAASGRMRPPPEKKPRLN